MATINYYIKGKKNPSPIYLRLAEGKEIDLWEKISIYINPESWEPKKQEIRKIQTEANRDEVNSNLNKLKSFIFDEFNNAYTSGTLINKIWLSDCIKKFFNRPSHEQKLVNLDRNIYLSDYAQFWITERAKKYKVSAAKYMNPATISHYQQVADNIKKFEGRNKIMLKNITSDLLDNFSTYLSEDEGYANQTVKRKLSRFKFFCERAEEDNLEVNKNFKTRVFVAEEEVRYKEPYFNQAEIDKIFKADLSHDDELDIVRDNLLIILASGLRVSDLQRLDISNFKDGYINIRTMKTNTFVTIPIHDNIKHVLMKRNGNLPPKVEDQKFNAQIKVLSRLLEFDNMMIGGIIQVGEDGKKRKVIGLYPKWKLVTSHIARRTFATLHYGKIPDKALMDLLGWVSPKMIQHYNKQTTNESADILKNFWEKQNY